MPHYTSIGIVFLQTFQQSLERFLLFRSTGIGWPVTGIQSAFVTDADGVGIVPLSMCPHLVEGTTGMNHSVARDVVVIADVGKATGMTMLYWNFCVAPLVESKI